MKKLLVVIQHIRRGGPELVAINYAEILDKTEYEISFLLINPYEDEDEAFETQLKEKGYEIYKMPEEAKGYAAKYKYLDLYFAEHPFDIVHSHVIFFSGFVLRAAAKHGVKVRASHSHIIRWNRKENVLYKCYTTFMRVLLKKYSNLKFSCSNNAGEFLYGKKEYERNGIFIANGIDTSEFAFNPDYRKELRNEFGAGEDTLVVGHVGTVYEIKNQSFLVEIFNEIQKQNPNSILVLAGQIVDAGPVSEKIELFSLQDKVFMTDSRDDIYKLYSAFDIMIFPSLFEALPVSLIEAQATKLPCLISDSVTTDVKFNENVDFFSLQNSPEEWAERSLNLLKTERNAVSNERLKDEYDIKNVKKKLERYYSELL